MDFVWAFVYPFQGRRWYLYLPLLAIGLIIPVFGIILGLVYGVAIVRRIYHGNYDPPGFDIQIVDGFHALWSMILHCIVFFMIAASLDILLNASKPADESIFNLVVLGIAILYSTHFFIGAIRYAVSDQTLAMIQIRHNLELIYQNRWRMAQFAINAILFWIAIVLLYAGLSMIAIWLGDPNGNKYYNSEDNPFLLLYILLFTPIALAMLVCGMSYMIGQLARRLDLPDEKQKRKNDSLSAEPEKQKQG